MKKNALKNYLKTGILLIGISVLIWNCQTDETLIDSQDQEIVIAKEAISKKNDTQSQKELNFNGSLDWDNAFIENEFIYVPINDVDVSFAFLDDNKQKTKKTARLLPFLVIQMDKYEISTENIKIFIDFKKTKELKIKELFKLHYILFNQNNEMLESSFVKSYKNKKTLSKETSCQLWGVFRVIKYSDGSTYEELLYTYEVCDSAPIDEEQADDGDGGDDTGTGENVIIAVDTVEPDCESFNYSRVGANDWQCAAVSGIHELFTTFGWDCIGYDFGSLPQALYFQLPINSTYGENTGSTAVDSAIYLQEAFDTFDSWYQKNSCTASYAVFTQTFLNYIKDEFEERGGNVTLTPPLGFTGTITPYKYTWVGYGDCN